MQTFPIRHQQEFSDYTFNFTTEKEKKTAAVAIQTVNKSVTENNELYKKGELNFESELNPFSHLTYEEFESSYLGLLPPIEAKKTAPTSFESTTTLSPPVIKSSFSSKYPKVYPECLNLAAYKNWAEENKTTSVQTQKCGECYLHSAITVLEAHAAIQSGKVPVPLSRLNTLECVKKFVKQAEQDEVKKTGKGCHGGFPQWIFGMAMNLKGLVSDATYKKPFKGDANGKCQDSLSKEADTAVE
jgi:hypothetical protein